MSAANHARLLALTAREFEQLAGPGKPVVPARSTFKAKNLNLARFDSSWDRKRGAAVRLTGILLKEDAAALERRVCESVQSAKVYADAAKWLQRESAYLRKVARMLDTATGRLGVVLGRCAAGQTPAQ
jgi:hypothetical protein